MALTPGTRLGVYDITAPIGEGGMGQVYRATDTTLGRQVAIKILPEAFAQDPDRLGRFEREAKTLASLNHPHIAAIYGFEKSAGMYALVMELVEGEDLSQRIARGAIPIEDALPIAKQIADALEAAHEQGIIHRDLKPANIKIRDDGTVKVLDFGLAKALDPIGSAPSASLSPTLSIHATQAGIILGTAAYMSPEQAKGRATDKRTDVWAFGCVLYEMLSARRAFDGEDVTEIIASVVKSEPDWARLPAHVPDPIRVLLKRCLEKDRRARVSDIGVARFVLAESLSPDVRAGANSPSFERRALSRRRVFAAGAAGLVAGITAATLMTWKAPPATEQPSVQPVRFMFAPLSPLTLALQGSNRPIALSPDGSRLVYQSEANAAGQQLVVRPLDQLELKPLSGIVGRGPFMSPDGRWIGYFTENELRKVSVLGGPPITICKMPPAPMRGATWAADGTIFFAVADPRTGLFSVPAAGGDPAQLTTPDGAANVNGHAYPFALPGGRSLLFTMASAQPENSQIAVLDLKTKEIKTLVRGGTDAKYVTTGHIVYASGGSRTGSLHAVRFDLARLEVLGDPVPVVDRVLVGGGGGANYDVSAQGTLAYLTSDASTQLRSLVWVNRQGREEPLDAPPRAYASPRLSPDGTRVALDIRDLTNDIWILDLARKLLTPLNVDPAFDLSPVWTADGKRIIWTSSRGGANPNLYWQAADGTGTPERLTTNVLAQFPTSVASDGTRVAFFEAAGPAPISTVTLPRSGPSSMKTDALIESNATKGNPEISPDGRWIAYESNEAGTIQVWVRPFPNVNDGRWQISLQGGTRPAWSRNGKELFYLDANDLLTSVAFQATGTTVTPGRPTKILNARYHLGATTRGYPLRGYDVGLDGQRFLMIKEMDRIAQAPAGVVIVVNWFEELKRLVPTK